MKGIMLAAGRGAAGLFRATPLINYSLATLFLAGIRETLIVAAPHEIPKLQRLLGGGERWGAALSYGLLTHANMSSDLRALITAAEFAGGDSVAVISADTVIYGGGFLEKLRHAAAVKKGARVFAFSHAGGENESDALNAAVPGLYFYDAAVVSYLHASPPPVDFMQLNRAYLIRDLLRVEMLDDETFCLSAAAQHSQDIKHRGETPGDLEYAARRGGLLNAH